MGCNLAKDEFLDENPSFLATLYINSTEVGEISAKKLMEILLYKKKISDKYSIRDKIITRDNFKYLPPK